MSFDGSVIRLATAAASHAERRLSVLAQNIANADTPGYRASDLNDFSKAYGQQAPLTLTVSRPDHIAGDRASLAGATEVAAASAPNGNSVNLEDMMTRVAETRLQHQLALGIYRSSRQIFRLALGRSG